MSTAVGGDRFEAMRRQAADIETAFEEGIKAAYDEGIYVYRYICIHVYEYRPVHLYMNAYICIAYILYIEVA